MHVVVGQAPPDLGHHCVPVGPGLELHEDVLRLALQGLELLLGRPEIHEHDRGGGEGHRVASAADDLEAPAEHLAVFADLERPVAAFRGGVHHDVAAAAEVLHRPSLHLPGQVPGREVLEGVDEAAFLGSGGELDVHELHDQVVGPRHPGHAAHPQHVGLREGVGEVHVGRLSRGHPDVGVAVLDGHGALAEKAHEQADLHEHQGHREGHPGDGDGEAETIVEEVLAGEGDHRSSWVSA